jgi:dUTP pyrophosphatase
MRNKRKPVLKLQVQENVRNQTRYASNGAAGVDLCCNSPHDLIVSMDNVNIGTGVKAEIPEGYVGLLMVRSSFGKKGLRLANTVGVIDPDYRGEIMAVVNCDGICVIKAGERFAQLLVVPCPQFEIEFVDELSSTERGAGGFGSTGA